MEFKELSLWLPCGVPACVQRAEQPVPRPFAPLHVQPPQYLLRMTGGAVIAAR